MKKKMLLCQVNAGIPNEKPVTVVVPYERISEFVNANLEKQIVILISEVEYYEG